MKLVISAQLDILKNVNKYKYAILLSHDLPALKENMEATIRKTTRQSCQCYH